MNEVNDWSEWQRHVLAELERLSESIDRMHAEFSAVGDRVTRVEERATIRAAFVGAVAGLVPVAVAVALRLL